MLSDRDKRWFVLQYLVDSLDDASVTDDQARQATALLEAAGIDLAAWAEEIRAKVTATIGQRNKAR
jgi:hypothetical protein